MVIINAYAFDKNSSAMCGEQIRANTKEEFNSQMKEFEDSIPFDKYYTELISDSELSDEDMKIVEDYDYEVK